MSKAAANTRRTQSAVRIAGFLAERQIAEIEGCADDVVDIVIDTVREPDREMIEAGRAELARALPTSGKVTVAYQRALVLAIWRAMMDRADR